MSHNDKHDQQQGAALIEQYRRIYLSVQPADRQGIVSGIGVTSARVHEGRSTVAVGMAATMSVDLDRPVVLVEVDVAHPGIHRLLDIPPLPGISEYLRQECELSAALRQVSDRLFVLPAGNAGTDAPRLTRRLVTADLRTRLGGNGAILIFDLPPILDTSYGVAAASMTESLIFVTRAGYSTTRDMKDALERLQPLAATTMVVNGAQQRVPTWFLNLMR